MALRGGIGIAAAGLLLAAGCSSKSDGGQTADGGPLSGCPVMDDLISDFNMDNGVYPGRRADRRLVHLRRQVGARDAGSCGGRRRGA